MKMSFKIVLFALIYASAVCHFEVFAAEQMIRNQKDTLTNFMKIDEKINYLSERVNKLEENSFTENKTIDEEENKMNIIQIMKNVEKNAEKMSKMEGLLLEILEIINDQKMNKRDTKSDVISEFNSQCNSMCESQRNIFINETSNNIKADLKNLDFCFKNSILINDQNFSTACDINPCLNGGQCEPTSYHCAKCPYPTTGRHCENLNCNKGNRCWQYQNSMFVVMEGNVSWNEAYNRCVSNRMRLAMPKDRDTSEFLIGQLRALYGEGAVYFWIGMKNDGTTEYRWIDGTLLGPYTGGMGDFKQQSGQRWAIMRLNGKNVHWHPRLLINTINGPHHALCEKRIIVRMD